MYDVSFALILASRSRRNLVVREFSIGRCPSVLPKFFSINFIAKNRKCYPSRAYSLKFDPLLIVNIFCYSDILVQLKDIQKNFHGISKSAPFFLIRSRKKELKTLSKPTTFFNIPTLMKHQHVSIAQQRIRFQILFWLVAKHFLFLMFNKYMTLKHKHLFNFIFVCSKV